MHLKLKSTLATFVLIASCVIANLPASYAQTSGAAQNHESARSDKFTGGHIERAALEPGQPDIKITINVPAFRLTLWQNGKEVAIYPIGVGRKEYPITIGERTASEIIWNPTWTPPNSEWVQGMEGVRPGEVIKAGDPRNPLGKLKIPLGNGYLIHQAAKTTDLGNLVSHGCIRMLRRDLYDLAEKIVAARSLEVTKRQIERAKVSSRMLVAALNEPLVVDINYDTQVVEEGVLHLYPDVYDRGTDRVENLRAELESSGVDSSSITDATLRRMLARPNENEEYAVSVESIKAGRALAAGRNRSLVTGQRTANAKRRA
ncbi:MAG: L,D-transpeptidase [Pyrinomonadaceae bacterium]|nr:L,D-transpeptidase [Pyrinomonadaceae bacterium]